VRSSVILFRNIILDFTGCIPRHAIT